MDKISCILLVDDDKTTNFLNRLLLENLGVTDQVLVAENGREALRLIEQNGPNDTCPALILLDINMPVMNGFDFLEAYQNLSFAHKQSVVIVMLTTSLNPATSPACSSYPPMGS
ncbi:response regulator [Hymenobacter sp. 5516J-16]|uniref:response regulator n=1 Tax=Hymenobacter sp. 5516J-16 TaxID=2932253 RepID=UPI001FD2E6CE|nr:response regulator [Hymenobacter sp. 5516J-16]UOQ76985.1 response regulator [Hymenobacter sp. 5516J-16]